MKYLFINTVAGSCSTGRIAADMCRELQAQGNECVLAYGRWENNCEDITTHLIGTSLDYKVHGVLTRLFDLHGFGSMFFLILLDQSLKTCRNKEILLFQTKLFS